MEKSSRRTIALLSGIFLWVFYIFQDEMANYGMYTVCSYRMHELASIIPFLCIGVTIGWSIYLVVRTLKKKSDKADKIFVMILLALVLFQGCYIHQMYQLVSTAVVATVESVDEQQEEIVIKVDSGQTVTLESPMLVNKMVETNGREYLVTYTWHKGKPSEGKLHMISIVE